MRNLVALILIWNCVKNLIVTRIVQKIKFEGDWGKLEAKKLFPETIIDKIYETNSSFHVKQRSAGKL